MLNRQFSHLFIVTIDEDDMQKNCNSATSQWNTNGYAISVSVCLYNIHLSPSAGVGCVRMWAVSWLYIPMLDARCAAGMLRPLLRPECYNTFSPSYAAQFV